MLTIDPKIAQTGDVYALLSGAVGPRPIAFASTLDKKGSPNLSPFSFFNLFSANPPIVVFAPVRRVRNNTTKHTINNILETKEVVINIVNYAIVQQMSLSSTEYDAGVDEFVKSGLTKLKSDEVKPFRVKESPVQLECKVNDVIELGQEGGAGSLVICEVVKMHIDEQILDEDGKIDQYKIDQVARMGGNWYSRANQGMFEVPKPLRNHGIGVDSIPQDICQSQILTGNDLGKLGNIEVLPSEELIQSFIAENPKIRELISSEDTQRIHRKAQEFLNDDAILEAWKLLLAHK